MFSHGVFLIKVGISLLSSDPLLSTLIQWSFLLLIVSLIPMECLYKGAHHLFSCCFSTSIPERPEALWATLCFLHTAPLRLCHCSALSLSHALVVCAAAVCSIIFWGSDSSEMSWGSVPCELWGQKHCPDHQFVKFTRTTTKFKTKYNVNHLMINISECSAASA